MKRLKNPNPFWSRTPSLFAVNQCCSQGCLIGQDLATLLPTATSLFFTDTHLIALCYYEDMFVKIGQHVPYKVFMIHIQGDFGQFRQIGREIWPNLASLTMMVIKRILTTIRLLITAVYRVLSDPKRVISLRGKYVKRRWDAAPR